MFVIAQQRHVDFFLLRPRFLRKRIVAADSVNSGVQIRCNRSSPLLTPHISVVQVPVNAIGKEKQKRVFLAEIVAQLDLLRSVGGLGRER